MKQKLMNEMKTRRNQLAFFVNKAIDEYEIVKAEHPDDIALQNKSAIEANHLNESYLSVNTDISNYTITSKFPDGTLLLETGVVTSLDPSLSVQEYEKFLCKKYRIPELEKELDSPMLDDDNYLGDTVKATDTSDKFDYLGDTVEGAPADEDKFDYLGDTRKAADGDKNKYLGDTAKPDDESNEMFYDGGMSL